MDDFTTELPLIDLDLLVKPLARVRLFGAVHAVFPVDGRAADLLRQIADRKRENGADDGNGNHLGLLYYEMAREVIAQVVPSLSIEERTRLTIEQTTTIIGLATKQVAAVETAIAASAEKNGGAATAPTTIDSAPGSTIRLPMSSSASPAKRGAPSSKSRTNRSP